MTSSRDDVLRVAYEYGRLMRALHFAGGAEDGPWALELNLTLSQLRVLRLLACQPDGYSGRALAGSLGVSPSAVTPLIDRLAEHGLARREEDPADRRVTRLLATPEGVALIERVLAGRREQVLEILDRLTPDELQLVERALAILNRAARADATSPAGLAAERPLAPERPLAAV